MLLLVSVDADVDIVDTVDGLDGTTSVDSVVVNLVRTAETCT
jgi:hypothetical protein